MLSIGSSSFLVGPAKQFRDMFAPERRVASLVYFATLFGTLVSTFVIKVQILSLLCVVAQFSALTWYMLSYIPYGQAAAKSLVRRGLKRAGVELPGGKAASVSPIAAAAEDGSSDV